MKENLLKGQVQNRGMKMKTFYDYKIDYEKRKGYNRKHRSNISGERVKVPIKDGTIEILVYLPSGKNDYMPIIFEVHGGGFMFNTCFDDDNLCKKISEEINIMVVACDYRTTPEYRYPTGLEDLYQIINYIVNQSQYHVDKEKIFLWGHSAGANLVAGVTLLSTRRKEFSIYKQIIDYPYMDVYREGKTRERVFRSIDYRLLDLFVDNYVEINKRKNPLVSPMYTENNEVKMLPETYLLLCGKDNLKKGGIQYLEKLKQAGVIYTLDYDANAIHGYIENIFNYENLSIIEKLCVKNQQKIAYAAVCRICSWIKERL